MDTDIPWHGNNCGFGSELAVERGESCGFGSMARAVKFHVEAGKI